MNSYLTEKVQRVGVYGFILNHENKILLIKRAAHDSNPNLWELPGGGLNHGENPEGGTIREVLEETGLRVKICYPLAVTAKVSDRDTSKHTIRISYLCRLIDKQPEVKLSAEHSEYTWNSLQEEVPQPISMLFEKCLENIAHYPYLITEE